MKKMKNVLKFLWLVIPILSLTFSTSCKKEEDPEPTIVEFMEATASVEETGSAVTVNIKFSEAASEAGTISVTSTGAVYDTDYTTDPAGPDFSLDIAGGASTASFTLTPVDDVDVFTNKTVTFTLSGVTGGLDLGDVRTCVVTINNDDVEPTGIQVDFAASGSTVDETSTDTLTVNLTLAAASVDGGTITISSSASQFGVDFVTIVDTVMAPEFDLSIEAGATEASFDVAVLDDMFNINDQTVTFTISAATGDLSVGSTQSTYELQITNDDQVTDISNTAYTNSFDDVTLNESNKAIKDESFLSNNLLNINVAGSKNWGWNNNKGVDANDFHLQVNSKNSQPEDVNVDSWIIAPALTTSNGSITVSLDAFNANEWQGGQAVTVKVSTDYIGEGDPTTYTWDNHVVDVLPLDPGDWQDWSATVNGISGNFYVALVFNASPAGFLSEDGTTTLWPLWRINNLKVE
jgi:hypothetical protein